MTEQRKTSATTDGPGAPGAPGAPDAASATDAPAGGRAKPAGKTVPEQPPGETGGPEGPEPTRYGDWEVRGRCSDF